ncbi:MAG: IS256 family transposase [Saprospiraceae bacterium]|nr:IS256 family transposase [Saprospiraceae bacterium]
MSRKKKKTLEDLFPDPELRQRVQQQLYSGDQLFGKDSVFSEMLQAIINAALEGEMDHFMEEERASDKQSHNRRNGHISKSVRSSSGPLNIRTPRDRHGQHNPLLIGKRERELKTGMDEIITQLYARGSSLSDIQQQIRSIYGVEMSEGLISSITDRIMDEVTQWQQRMLAPCYAVIYLDGIHYRTRQDGISSGRTVYTVYGVDTEGNRDILGLYVFEEEGARNWGLVLEDLQRRGVESVLFFCVDGLSGFKEVISEVYPKSIVQRCIVHMVRRSTRFVAYQDLKKVCAGLRKVYTAANRQLARQALEVFERQWAGKYPEIVPKWDQAWEELMAFMDYTQPIRRMIYTTNPVEAVHRILRKVTKTKGTWPNDRALLKQLYLALKYEEKSWKRQAYHWTSVQRDLLEKFGDQYGRYLMD